MKWVYNTQLKNCLYDSFKLITFHKTWFHKILAVVIQAIRRTTKRCVVCDLTITCPYRPLLPEPYICNKLPHNGSVLSELTAYD